MKRFVVALLLLAFVFAGCSSSGEEKKNKLNIDESKLHNNYTIEEITEDNTKEGLDSVIKYPKISNMSDKALEDVINGAVKERLDRYKQVSLTMSGVADEAGGEVTDLKLKEVFNVSYEVAFKSKYTLSIKLMLSNYFVDLEEPDVIIDALNFDLRTGTQYELKELFKDKNKYVSKLNPILDRKVQESGKTVSNQFKGVEENQGFYFKESGLVLYYQTIPYTSPQAGPLELEIAYDEIKDLLKDPKTWQKEQSSASMNEYNKVVNEETRPLEALSFIDGKIRSVSQEEATIMILSFEEIQARYLTMYEDSLIDDSVQNELFKTFEYNFDENRVDEIKDEKVKSLVKEVLDGGYSIINVEGSFTPIPNYQVLEKYSGLLESEVRDYISFKAIESERMIAMVSGYITGWSELEERLVSIENYLSKYPDSIKGSEMMNEHQFYLHAYLFGFDNNPAFSYETNKIGDELLDSYRAFISNNVKSETAKLLESYLELIEKNNYTLCEEVETFRQSITKDPEFDL